MKVNKDKCLSCQACVSMCPHKAIAMKGDKPQIDKKKCVKCGACMHICPVGAITDEE